MVIRRTDAQRAAARLRRLNDPEPPRRSRRRGRNQFPEPGAITELFREARRAHR
jgi:hypothetical protein